MTKYIKKSVVVDIGGIRKNICPGSWIVTKSNCRHDVLGHNEFFRKYEEAAAYLKTNEKTPEEKIVDILDWWEDRLSDGYCHYSSNATATLLKIAKEIIVALKGETP